MNEEWNLHKLIVVVIKRGMSRKILKASKAAGADGGTVMFAKGTGDVEIKSFLGIPMEPEKEVVLILVPKEMLEQILNVVEKAGKLDKPGHGIGFVLDAKQIAGVSHWLQRNPQV